MTVTSQGKRRDKEANESCTETIRDCKHYVGSDIHDWSMVSEFYHIGLAAVGNTGNIHRTHDNVGLGDFLFGRERRHS
jgi:hypothetical protein